MRRHLTGDQLCARVDLYGALWLICSRFHGGQGSRGYRILSRLTRARYQPSLTLQRNQFESEYQRHLYRQLWKRRETL